MSTSREPRRHRESPQAAEVAVLESVAVSLEGDDLGVVDEAVDHRGGDIVAEYLAPAAEGLVAGDDQRGAFVAGRDELEEQVRRLGFERDVADANAALFQVISQRYLKGSVIITSHAGIATWADRFADPMMAAAVLDRLLHRGIVAAIDGPSYRMRAHQARAEQLRRAVRP